MQSRRRFRWFAALLYTISGIAVLGACCFMLFIFNQILLLDLGFNLTFGWIASVIRHVQEVSISWPGVATALFCLMVLTWGTHRFCGWLWRELQKRRRVEVDLLPWQWSWTVKLLTVVLLMFLAGIAAVGISHQSAWLITSPEPILERRGMQTTRWRFYAMRGAFYAHHGLEGHFPSGTTMDAQGRLLHGWQTQLLPFLEPWFPNDPDPEELQNRIRHELPWNDPRNAAPFQAVLQHFLNPDIAETKNGDGYALSHYAGNVRVLGGTKTWTLGQISIGDGAANTLMVGEVASGFKPWGHPANWRDPGLGLQNTPQTFGSPFSKGVQFLFVDGSVRRLKHTVDPQVLKALSTPRGGEPVDLKQILEE